MRSITVAADGTGEYRSIQSAVDAIPDERTDWTLIRVKKGVYREKLQIRKPRIRIQGENARDTIVVYDDYARKVGPDGEPYHTFRSFTAYLGGDDLEFEQLTFENAAGSGDRMGQALAVYADGDRLAFRHCRLLGHQDTLFTGPLPERPSDRAAFGGPSDGAPRRPSRQYYEHCYIEGDVDFIFGSATAWFEHCDLYSHRRLQEEQLAGGERTHGWITAASTPPEAPYGYVFRRCRLIGDAPPASVYLGRPWRENAGVLWLNCWMDAHIKPEGWHNWNKPERESSFRYGEYGSSGPGAGEGKRVSWASALSAGQAEAVTPSSVLGGADGWSPHLPRRPGRPTFYLAGDSTVADYPASRKPMLGWGARLPACLDPDIAVSNEAMNGRSTMSFIKQGRLDSLLERIGDGDILLIQFGHNDAKADDPERYTSPDGTYTEYLKQYVAGARTRGATPILVTPLARRYFDDEGRLEDTHREYRRAMIALAERDNVPLLDLTALSAALLRRMGPEASKALFCCLPAGEYPAYPDGLADNTHLNETGADAIARIVADALRELPVPGLRDCMRE